MIDVALDEARAGLAEGGIPIGAALFAADGTLLGRGHNRRVQDGDPSMHAETAAFRAAGRQRDYRSTTMVTTLSPCWYCSGLVRQFGIGAVVVGEARTFSGGHDWLAEHGVAVTVLNDERCAALMADFVAARPELWFEDIGQVPCPVLPNGPGAGPPRASVRACAPTPPRPAPRRPATRPTRTASGCAGWSRPWCGAMRCRCTSRSGRSAARP